MPATAHSGFGLGFRAPHYEAICGPGTPRQNVDWFELLADNYFRPSKTVVRQLSVLRERHQVTLHSVGLSLAGTDPLDSTYLAHLKQLVTWLKPACVSDHLAWSRHGGKRIDDLLPVAYNAATLDLVCARVSAVQDVLGRQILVENPTSYLDFAGNDRNEAEFLSELVRRTGAGILLDVNNLYINMHNLGMDAVSYLMTLPDDAVGYIHLAGHNRGPHITIDTHGAHVCQGVWDLYGAAARRFRGVGTLIEWDNSLPEWPVLLAELDKARTMHAAALQDQAAYVPDVQLRTKSMTVTPAHASAPWQDIQVGFLELIKRLAPTNLSAMQHFATDTPVAAGIGIGTYRRNRINELKAEWRRIFSRAGKSLGANANGIFTGLAEAWPDLLATDSATPAVPDALRRLGYGTAADWAAVDVAAEDLRRNAPPVDAASTLDPEILRAVPVEYWADVVFELANNVRIVRNESVNVLVQFWQRRIRCFPLDQINAKILTDVSVRQPLQRITSSQGEEQTVAAVVGWMQRGVINGFGVESP